MSTGHEQYVQFQLGREKYAIQISDIHEIIKMQDISEIPGVMTYVRGVINLRGKIVPVISLRTLFGMGEEEYSKHTRVVVVNHMDETIGIIVDRVDKVTTFSDIQAPPERVGGIHGAHFSGIGLYEQSIVGILRLDQVLVKEGSAIEQH